MSCVIPACYEPESLHSSHYLTQNVFRNSPLQCLVLIGLTLLAGQVSEERCFLYSVKDSAGRAMTFFLKHISGFSELAKNIKDEISWLLIFLNKSFNRSEIYNLLQ